MVVVGWVHCGWGLVRVWVRFCGGSGQILWVCGCCSGFVGVLVVMAGWLVVTIFLGNFGGDRIYVCG